MIRNYLKIALRNLRKEKIYTFVNVFGLALGVGCVLLILLFVRHEWSYDRFHDASDRIYRAWGKEDWGEGREFFYTVTPVVLAPTLRESIPEVEATVRIRALTALVGPETNRFNEEVRMVDTTFFDVFDFHLMEGLPGRVFPHPNTVVITPEFARKYFGDEPAVGQSLMLDLVGEPEEFEVTGVAAEPPAESSIRFGLLIPFTKAPDLMNEEARSSWFNVYVETYVLLDAGATREGMEAKLPVLLKQVLGETVDQAGYRIGLQPITDVHLNTAYPVGIEPISTPVYSYMLGAIALLVLVVGSINFITLSIGQSVRRAGEVGVRKAMGAARVDVMRQFWGEAFLIVVFGVILGAALARLALPFFNALSGRELTAAVDPLIVFFLAGLSLLIALMAGVYPALVLSGLRPIDVLRGRIAIAADRSLLRRGLVVLQFSISILMITATLFVVEQLNFIKSKDLGYQREHVVVLRTGVGPERSALLVDRMRTDFQGDPRIVSLASSAFPMNESWARVGFDDDAGQYRAVMANVVSPEFLETMKIQTIAGRGFSRERSADSAAVVVNEAFARDMGFGSPEDAIGRRIPGASFAAHEIVGVVPDFNFESLHTPVQPLVLVQTADWLFQGANDVNVASSMRPDVSLRIAAGDLRGTIERIERAWTAAAPDLPFEFYFLDDALDAQYRQEERLGRIVATAAGLAILIACLGVFGLASLAVVRRRKEIGIRKVLGATVANIVVLFSRDFAALVGIAFVVAVPFAYLLVRAWLEDFAYQVAVTPWTFLAAGLVAVVGALVTVSFQSIRAASADPVTSLRYE